MTTEGAKQTLYLTILVIGICGFEIAAGLTSLAGIVSTPSSIAVRLFVATCAFIAILLDFGKAFRGPRMLILGFFVFWCLYLLRIAYSTTVALEVISYPAWYYFTWSIGACALPMLGLSLWSPRHEDADRNFMALFIALAVGGLLASFGASSLELNQNNELVETGRLHLAALNPILLGQLGTTLLAMTVWVLVNRHYNYSLVTKMLFITTAVIGIVLLIGANSRGPLVSAAACLIFISMVTNKRSRLYAIAFLVVVVIAFVPATQYLESEYGFSTYTRLFGQSQLTEVNTQDRLTRYIGALNAFAGNPFFGASLEEPTYGGYPHNVFIEALMATGIIGGTLLITLATTTLFYAIKISTRAKEYGWASVLFIQYLVAAQFSGGIHTITYFWISAGLVISIHASLVKNIKSRAFSLVNS